MTGRWAWLARLWRTQSETVEVHWGPEEAQDVFEPVLDTEGLIDVEGTVEKYRKTQKWGPFLSRRAREQHMQWVRETYEDLRREQERGF
jgi:hypothetical protein